MPLASRRARLLEAGALLLLLLALSARSLLLSRAHGVPIYDEVAYIQEAREFAAEGGALGTIACHLQGRCRGDNRHPLFELAMMPFMKGDGADFARGKLASLASALLMILAFYAFSRALHGPGIALVAAAIPALSWRIAILSQQVLADLAFAALFFSALALLALREKTRAGWLGFGLLAGLGYLCKGSAHLMLLAPLALAVVRRAPRRLALALAGFAGAASFLLWRNARVWGNPFHNRNAKLFWLDEEYRGWLLPFESERWKTMGPLEYFRDHDFLEVIERVWTGLGGAGGLLVDTLGSGPQAWHGLIGLTLLALAGFGLWIAWKEGRRAELLALSLPSSALLAALVWGYRSGMNGTRLFIAPALMLTLYAAVGARELLLRLWDPSAPPPKNPWLAPILVSAAALAALWPSRAGLSRDPRGLWTVPEHWRPVAEWLISNVGERGYLLSSESYFTTWHTGREMRHMAPFNWTDEDLLREARRRRVQVIILDAADEEQASHPRRFGAVDAHGPLSFLGWPRCFHDPLRPSQLLVYCRPGPKG